MSSYESIFDVEIVDDVTYYTTISDDFIDTNVEFTRDNYKNPPLWLLKPEEKIIIDVETENSEKFDLQVRKLIDPSDGRILSYNSGCIIACQIRNSNQENLDGRSLDFHYPDSIDFSGIENLFKQYFNKEIKITVTPYCVEINGINFKAIEFRRSGEEYQGDRYFESPFQNPTYFHYNEGDYECLFLVGNDTGDGVIMFNNRFILTDSSYGGGYGEYFAEINKKKISDSHYRYIYKNINKECEYLQMTLNSIDNDQGRLKITKTIIENEIKHVKLDYQSEIPHFTKIIHVTKGQTIKITPDDFIVKNSSGVSACSITCNSVPEELYLWNNEISGVINESCYVIFTVSNGEDSKQYKIHFIVTNN